MPNYLKAITVICCAFTLFACKENLTYNYLIQHPDVLKRKIDECQTQAHAGTPLSKECEVVFYAAANFISVMDEAGNDPEKLGQKIIDLEIDYAKLKTEFETAKAEYEGLVKQHANADAAKERMETARKAMDEKEQEIRFLLAVVGLNSPE